MERSQSASDLKVNFENDSRKSPTNQKCQKFRNPGPCFNQPLGNVVIDDAFRDEHPLLNGSSKLPKISKNKLEDESVVESTIDNDRPTDPVTDNILPVDPAPAIPSRIKVDKYLIDDIVVPEIEPVDLIPLDPTGFLYLPEHGIKEELEGLDFEHEQNQIIRETLEDFLLNSDEIERKFDYDQIIEQLQDELGLPKQKVTMTSAEAEAEVKKEIAEYNRRIEEERFKQAQLDVKPENVEHKAFRELEEMLKSGKLFPTDQDDLLNSDNFWNLFESTIPTNESLASSWSQIHAAWKALFISDDIKESLSAAYANQDDEYMARAGALWRDLAHAIKQREMKLQEFQDFLFEQAEPQRFWSRGYCPVREENRREVIRVDLKAKTRKVEVLLNELEPKIGMEVPWLNRSYREKLQKDEIEAFFFVHHSLRMV